MTETPRASFSLLNSNYCFVILQCDETSHVNYGTIVVIVCTTLGVRGVLKDEMKYRGIVDDDDLT